MLTKLVLFFFWVHGRCILPCFLAVKRSYMTNSGLWAVRSRQKGCLLQTMQLQDRTPHLAPVIAGTSIPCMLPPTPPLCLCPSFSLFWNLLPPTPPLSLYPSFSLFWNPLIYFCEQASLQIPPLTLQPTLTSHSLHLNKEQPS